MLTEKDLQILENLNKYRYLTNSQMIKLGIGKYRPNINRQTIALEKLGYILKLDFGADPQHGRLENMYCLTRKGAEFLITELGYYPREVTYPKNISSLFKRDYFHRKATIDFNILFQDWSNYNNYPIEYFYYYFDKTGSNRNKTGGTLRAKTKIDLGNDDYIIPDGVGKFNTSENAFAFLFEMHNGKDTGKAVRQILKHAEAQYKGKPQELLNFFDPIRIYWIIELPQYKETILQTLDNIEHIKPFENIFRFKTWDDLQIDFWSSWDTINRNKVNFI